MNREKVFKDKEKLRRKRAKMPFREKLRILIELQRIAKGWEQQREDRTGPCEQRGTADGNR